MAAPTHYTKPLSSRLPSPPSSSVSPVTPPCRPLTSSTLPSPACPPASLPPLCAHPPSRLFHLSACPPTPQSASSVGPSPLTRGCDHDACTTPCRSPGRLVSHWRFAAMTCLRPSVDGALPLVRPRSSQIAHTCPAGHPQVLLPAAALFATTPHTAVSMALSVEVTPPLVVSWPRTRLLPVVALDPPTSPAFPLPKCRERQS